MCCLVDTGQHLQPCFSMRSTALVQGRQQNYCLFSISLADPIIIGTLFYRNEKISNNLLQQLLQQSPLDQLARTFHGDFVIIYRTNEALQVLSSLYNSNPLYLSLLDERQILLSPSLKGVSHHQRSHLQVNWDLICRKHPKSPNGCWPTMVEKVYRIKGSTHLSVNLDSLEVNGKHYFQPEPLESKMEWDAKEYVTQYRQLLNDTAVQQAATVDKIIVPLSGGFDSSVLFNILSRAYPEKITAASICTASSIRNHEIQRAMELTRATKAPHLIMPVKLSEGANAAEWYELVTRSESLECGFESFLKSQLVSVISTTGTADDTVFSGTGSDQFAGGTTTLDYSIEGLHQNWEDFIQAMAKRKWEHYQQTTTNDFFNFAINFFAPDFRAAQFPFSDQQLWFQHQQANHHFLDRKSVFLEAKLYTSQSFATAYPFLNRQLIQLLLSIPPTLYPELLFDKQILQRACGDLLPNSFQGYRKFYRSKKVNDLIFKYFHSLIYDTKKQRSLLNQVLDASPLLSTHFDKTALQQFLKATADSKMFPSYTNLLGILNLGILDLHLFQGENLNFPNTTTPFYVTQKISPVLEESLLQDDY